MHAQSLIVTLWDILPDDEDFHLNTLSENNDYLFWWLMINIIQVVTQAGGWSKMGWKTVR